MIVEVEGDILKSKAQAIAHGIAPNDDFHSGLALALRENWPSLYKDFRHFCKAEHPAPGAIWGWRGTSGQTILSLMTQESAYGVGARPGKAKIEYVRRALQNLAAECRKEGFKTLAIPCIATGVGGLDWKEVEPLIEEQLGALPTKVFVYSTYRKGVQAAET